MTLRELNDMARQYGLDPDSELAVRPLIKDTPRKVTNISIGTPGTITLMCNRPSTPKRRRR